MTSIIAACLNPPAITASQGLPPWILLDTRVYLAHHDDATTATAETSRGHTVQVSIRFADPPALSHVCLHCPGLQEDNFAEEPRVVRSEKQFLLLHLPLNWSTRFVVRSSEYYVYQAIPGKPPSLSRIPDPPEDLLLMPQDLGIYCCNDDDDGYILAGLCPTTIDLALGVYGLCLYSSASKVWTSKFACLERQPLEEHYPTLAHKVIPLGGSLLGWVDLWKGMLVCDVLSDGPYQDDPLVDPLDSPVPVWFVPLPGLLPGNQDDQHVCPWMVRDVTCTDGSLRLVEVELLITAQNVVKESMVTYDESYDESCFVKEDAPAPPRRRLVGWRSVVWNRVLSDKGWRRGCEVHDRDIQAVNSCHSALLADLGNRTSGIMKSVMPSFPTLSIHGDDVVHMNCLVRSNIAKAHMISIDMRNKTLKTSEPCLPGELEDRCPHFPCVLSNHLRNTPALPQVVHESNSKNVNAASRQIVQASNSENVTETQCLRSCAQEVVGAPNRAQNALPQAVRASNPENVTETQRVRSCAQEVIGVPNPAQNCGPNFDLSLGSQQSFGLSDARTSYNASPCEYADYTRPDNGNYQRPLTLQQQPYYTFPSYGNYQRPLTLQQQPYYTRPSYDSYPRPLALQQQQPDYTWPGYENYQKPLALQQQPDYTWPGYENHQRPLALQQQPAYLPNWPVPSSFSSGPVNAHPTYPAFNTASFGQMVHPLPRNNCQPFQPPSQAVVLPTPFRAPLPPMPHALPGGRPIRPNRHSPYERPR